MRRTLQQQIAANRRASLVYASLLIVLLAALGASIAGYIDPSLWPAGALGAAAVGAVMAIVSQSSGSQIVLSISQARTATPLELQKVENITEEMAIAAGIPKPKVYVIDDTAPNAFATGTKPENGVVVVTQGLLQKLDRDELQGVIAHEVAHIRNYDIRLMTTLAIVAGLIPLLADFFIRMTWYSGGRGSRRSSSSEGNAQAVFMLVGLVLAILAPIFAKLLEMAVSRQREFLADATAAELTRYPEGLASALRKISRDQEPLEAANRATAHMYIVNPLKKLSDASMALFSTHPPLEDRIRALTGLMGNDPLRVPRTPQFEE